MHPALQATLAAVDPDIAELIAAEERRQRDKVRLIASENYVSGAVLAATGSVLTNKYSEGYPGKRYYEGQQYIDQVEQLCIDRAKALFGADHANVQPYSGSPANLAIYFAFLKPGDTVMGMGLPAGGHLTHGWNVSITGSYFRAVQYGVRRDTHRIDLDEVRDLARKERPKLLFARIRIVSPRRALVRGSETRRVGGWLAITKLFDSRYMRPSRSRITSRTSYVPSVMCTGARKRVCHTSSSSR
jgi:glycine hydroxymethyltransferase